MRGGCCPAGSTVTRATVLPPSTVHTSAPVGHPGRAGHRRRVERDRHQPRSPAAPTDQQGAPLRCARHDREVLPVHRRRRRLGIDLPVADGPRQRRRRVRPGQLRAPVRRDDQRGHVGAGLHVGDGRGDVVAAQLRAVGHQRLAVDEQPHPPDVDLGERQHDLRGEQPSGGAVEVAGAGQVDDDGPVRARRDVRAQPGAGRQLRDGGPGERRWTARRAAGRSPGRPAPWRARWARTARRATASCRIGSTNQARTVRKSSRKIDSGTTTPSGSREIRHCPSRRTTSTSHWNGDCAGSNAPAWVSRPDRGAADPDGGGPGRRVRRAGRGHGVELAVEHGDAGGVVPASPLRARGTRGPRRAGRCCCRTRRRSRGPGRAGCCRPPGRAAARGLVASPTWRSTCTGELSGTLAHPASPSTASATASTHGRRGERRGNSAAAHGRSPRAPGRYAVGDRGPAQRRCRDRCAHPVAACPAPDRAAAGWTPARRRPCAAASAGTPRPCPARPRPAASRRAAGRPRRRWTAPARCRRCAGPATPRPARTG